MRGVESVGRRSSEDGDVRLSPEWRYRIAHFFTPWEWTSRNFLFFTLLFVAVGVVPVSMLLVSTKWIQLLMFLASYLLLGGIPLWRSWRRRVNTVQSASG